MKKCDRCVYQGSINGTGGGCAYIQITGKSRLAKVYKKLGVNHITDEVRKLMDPARCKQFVPGPRRMVADRHELLLDGSRPKKQERGNPSVWPRAPKLGETR